MLRLLLFIACSTAPDAGATASGPPAAVVDVAPAREGGLSDRWTVNGEVRALERAELAAGASGTVTVASAREGDRVEQGQLLVEVDLGLAEAELSAARAAARRVEARLEQARTVLARVDRVKSGVLAGAEIDAARSEVAALEAEHAQAQANSRLASARLDRHRVRAPFPGVVSARHVDVGDWVDPGQSVLDLVRVDGVEVLVDAAPELASAVAPGDTVELGASTGRIIAVVPAFDPATRTARLRIAPDAPERLSPGSAVSVTFAVQRSGGVVVPRDAVVPGGDGQRVFRIVEGVAQAIAVTPIASTADEVLVQADGLAPGDQLVVRGNERLRPDQTVTVSR